MKIIKVFLALFILTSCSNGTEQAKIHFTATDEEGNLFDCSKTSIAHREKSSQWTPQEALNELFKGPTDEEKTTGMMEFWISEDLSDNLIDVKVEKETVYVNWKDIRKVAMNASSSCGSQSFLAPIDKTLLEFPEIKKVIHMIEGNAETFYEWMQLETPEIL